MRHDLVRRHVVPGGRGQHELSVRATLGFDIFNRRRFPRTGFAFGGAERQHGNIAVIAEFGRRRRQRCVEMLRPFHLLFTGCHPLHGVPGCVPGTAAAGPAGTVFHTEFESQPVRLPRRVQHHRAPFRAQKLHRPGRNAAIHVYNRRPADADTLHRLEIRGDALLRNVAIHPMPPGLWPGGIRWMAKAVLECIGPRRCRQEDHPRAGRAGQCAECPQGSARNFGVDHCAIHLFTSGWRKTTLNGALASRLGWGLGSGISDGFRIASWAVFTLLRRARGLNRNQRTFPAFYEERLATGNQ